MVPEIREVRRPFLELSLGDSEITLDFRSTIDGSMYNAGRVIVLRDGGSARVLDMFTQASTQILEQGI